MKPQAPPARALHDKAFVLLLVAISIAFVSILLPFYAAILWATILAILFMPLYRRLCTRFRQRRTLAALATLAIILLIVVLPAGTITGMLLQEGLALYARMQSGELDVGRYLKQTMASLPAWAGAILDRFGLTSLGEVQQRFSAGLTKGLQFFAGQALNIGQNTLDFVVGFFIMLYLLFFLLRDGNALVQRMREVVPLHGELQDNLVTKFGDVARATIKGNVAIAIVQGLLGGLIFWILGVQGAPLWGVVMAFLSLLPAVGTALVWLPVAIYLLVTGSVWQGVVLIAFGVVVIGLVDNVLRPILVGKDTKMPDYVVLMSTLGGMAIFGFNGFVIGPMIAAMFIAVWDTMAVHKAKTGSALTS